jgi:hypothetical protein
VRSSLARVVAVVALAAAAASCTRPLDTSGLQATLKQQLEAELGTTGLNVTCPTDVKVKAGTTFRCTVTKSGAATLTIDVTQTDDKGHVTWKVSGASTATPPPAVTPSPSM